MKRKFVVSIIIPVYKVEDYLAKCLDSVINQTYKELEIIVVDDGSPDKCPEICDEYAARDERVTVLHKKNGGQSSARNGGLSIASGDYCMFVDSDDYLNHKAIETLLNYALSNDLDIVGFNAITVNTISTQKNKPYLNRTDNNSIVSGEEYLVRSIKSGSVFVPVWLYLYKMSLIKNNAFSFVEGRIYEDDIWTPSILLKASRVSYIDYAGYYYLIRPGSTMTSSKKSEKNYNNHWINCQEIIKLKDEICNKNYRNVFSDYEARLLMEATKYLDLNDPEQKKKVDYGFIKDNIHGVSSWIKYLLFRYNYPLYLKFKSIKNK